MLRLFALALVTLAALIGVSHGALAEDSFTQERYALVIGNSKYRAVTPLPNPVRDAAAISDFLKSARFQVTTATDLDQAGMRHAVREFAATLADKGEDAVALIYFAGHGVQVDGVNYLLPVDAEIKKESDVALQGVSFSDIMNLLGQVRSKTRIVILDACRNDPFKNSTPGLAIVNAPAGSLVAYSTSPGATAADGDGTNSPFTRALMNSAKPTGVTIETALKNARLTLHKRSGGQQVPWEVSSLVQPFSFFPGEGPTEVEPAAEKSAAEWRKELKNLSADEAFEVAVRENKVVVYKEYIALFPRSSFAREFRGTIDLRVMMWAWFDAVTRNDVAAYEAFLKRYPTSGLADTAKRLLQRARAQASFASASPGSLGIAASAPQVVYRNGVKEVPVEKIVYRDRVKEVPVEKIVYRDHVKEVPVEKIVYRERVKIVPKIEYRDKIVYREKIVPKIVYRDKVVYKTRTVTVAGHCSSNQGFRSGGTHLNFQRFRRR